ncbi:Crp/Fnr family transcriptional regulator [Paenibacillus hemerocallicola]|jgi:CRP/FNR family transcriptional regulator|uniref:Crp/Fnr family transcriptional regulator n=1 Tax=Paenibacillus hemerocallicola TaxID=1172614 RepID=A0A5C4T0T9_9BACL|nr:Crp/Fnr family transcriptional regulator [Paenibacillus hemerocallicola]TNJ61857.1 Crp/Fnr family transcriptional regulator [Paenibacillus hemerocallicola]
MTSFQPHAGEDNAMNTSCFSPDSMDKLKDIMHEIHVEAGAGIYWEGDLADKLYYIGCGKVKCTKTNEHGKEFVMYLFREGDFMGQLDPYADSRQSFTARAMEPCTIGVVQKSDLEMLLWQHGDLAVEFMKWMGLMHRMTQTKFRDLMLYGKPGALCSTIIRLANTFGKATAEGILITEKWTHTDLADTIGAARESVNRMLGEWKREGVIDQRDGYLLITNLNYLQQICHCELCPKEICRL